MTEDELFFAIETVRDELRRTKGSLKMATGAIMDLDRAYDKSQMVKKSLLDALKHLQSSPVVSMNEYFSLKNGIKATEQRLVGIKKELQAAKKTRSQAEAELPKLELQLADLEHQLETYIPPRVVLEFKRNDKR